MQDPIGRVPCNLYLHVCPTLSDWGMFGVFHICVKCMAEVRKTTGGGSKECMFTITYDGKLIVILFFFNQTRYHPRLVLDIVLMPPFLYIL